MNAEQCYKRASECAQNAALAGDADLAVEFLQLAAQWRAMAMRDVFLGRMDEPEPIGGIGQAERTRPAPAR
jgi:hypothetical protein